jgi:hypothetical protein
MQCFRAKFLHAIFAKEREPQRRGLGNRLGREGLRDSHQLDFAARTRPAARQAAEIASSSRSRFSLERRHFFLSP